MENKLKREIYKKLCLKKELTSEEKREYELFINSGGNIGLIKGSCCYCNKELSESLFFIVTSYWSPMWKPSCSESCAKINYNLEELECQNIDANCNECIYFQREEYSEKSKAQTKNIFQNIGCYIGICKNKKSKYYNKEVGANRNTFQGMLCFKHRKEVKNGNS